MKGSYQFEKLEDRHIEADRLAVRSQMRLEGFEELLQRYGFPKAGRVLEVGTGQGLRASKMAAMQEHCHVVGVDRSFEMLNRARNLYGDKTNLEFLEADIYDLPFAENTFDFIYARLVFMHLSDPMAALQNLKKILKPGGVLLIEDADRDCMFFEPAPKSFASFWHKVQEGQRKLGGDPNVGRKLASYFKSLKLKDIQVEVQPLYGSGKDIAFLVETLMPSLNIYLDPQDRDFGQQAIKELEVLSQSELATFYHFWFIAVGVKDGNP